MFLCMSVFPTCMYLHCVSEQMPTGWKWAVGALEVEKQTVVSHSEGAGIEPGSSERSTGAPNHLASFPGLAKEF